MTNVTMLVRNRPRLTQQALDSLRPTKDRAVTVLDDRSDPETRSILEAEHQKLLHVVYSDVPTGTGVLRNRVIRENEEWFGRYEYLYLSDNDVLFHPSWLVTLVSCYAQARKKGFMVIGAYNHPYHQPIDEVPVNYQYGIPIDEGGGMGRYKIQEVQALALQSMMMSWDVWDKYGPFCETPEGKVCQGEDVDFTNKIRADGGKIGVVSPALVVNTGITNSFGEKIPGWEMVKAQCPPGVLCE